MSHAKNKEVKKVFFQSYFPQDAVDLRCIDGNISRSTQQLNEILASSDVTGSHIRRCYDGLLRRGVGESSQYMSKGAPVHIRNYLEYLLSIRTEVELKAEDGAVLSSSNVPTDFSARMYQEFERGFNRNLRESISQVSLEGESIRQINEALKGAFDEASKEVYDSGSGEEGLSANFLEGKTAESDYSVLEGHSKVIIKAIAIFVGKLTAIGKIAGLDEGAISLYDYFDEKTEGDSSYYQLNKEGLATKIAQKKEKTLLQEFEKRGIKFLNPALGGVSTAGDLSADIYSEGISGEILSCLKSDDLSLQAHGVTILYLLSNKAPGVPTHHFVNMLFNNIEIVKALKDVVVKEFLPDQYLEKISNGSDVNKKIGILESYHRDRQELELKEKSNFTRDQKDLEKLLFGSTKSCKEFIGVLGKERRLGAVLEAAPYSLNYDNSLSS